MVDQCSHQEHPPCEGLTLELIGEVKLEIQRACQSRKHIEITYFYFKTHRSRWGRAISDDFATSHLCFYWEQSAQPGGRCSSVIVAEIYKEWFRRYSEEPNIVDGHFFANPIYITSNGPTTISRILQAHREICKQADSLLDKIGSGEVVENRGYPWPDPKRYNLFPLLRSIIVIMEEIAPISGITQDDDGLYLLDELAQIQSVLLVRTGDESDLSAPITFDGLQSTAIANKIRVSLSTAVKFITSLHKREEEACSDPRGTYSSVSSHLEILHRIHYSDNALQSALLNGTENYSHEIRNAIRRVNARRRGETLPESDPFQFNIRWKYSFVYSISHQQVSLSGNPCH